MSVTTEHTREAYATNHTNSTRNKTKNNNKKSNKQNNKQKIQKKEQVIIFYNIAFSIRFHTVFPADNDSRSTRETSEYNSGKLVAYIHYY